ncbi:battenin CLN3 protein [Mortierella claussenii]|nr:battenin CLN3 protein [Mortierella claussenii]
MVDHHFTHPAPADSLFKFINNLIYVVILSAAVDLVGAEVPKGSEEGHRPEVVGIVLLADITPSLLIKMIAPYFIHKVPYPIRVTFCASLSFSAVVIIALADTIQVRLLGVMMASLSSGLGELTFLMLSSFYRLQMVSAWSSGTGGAGLLGALMFLALTSWIGLSIPHTLGIVALFPMMMLIAYFVILTSPTSQSAARHQAAGYRPLTSSSHHHEVDEELLASPEGLYHPHHQPSLSEPGPLSSMSNGLHPNSIGGAGDDAHAGHYRHASMSTDSNTVLASPASPRSTSSQTQDTAAKAIATPISVVTSVPPIGAIAPPASAPLAATTAALPSASWNTPQWSGAPLGQHQTEPTSINTLLAATDPDDPEFVSPFREAEVGGDGDEEEGSTGGRRRVYRLEPNEALTMDEKFTMARSLLVPYMVPLFLVYVAIYLIFILILWEGLLGGATYVHTYIGISRSLQHDPKGKEFALGVVGVADGLGILVAGVMSLWIEPALCRWQVVEKGIELCLAMAD